MLNTILDADQQEAINMRLTVEDIIFIKFMISVTGMYDELWVINEEDKNVYYMITPEFVDYSYPILGIKTWASLNKRVNSLIAKGVVKKWEIPSYLDKTKKVPLFCLVRYMVGRLFNAKDNV